MLAIIYLILFLTIFLLTVFFESLVIQKKENHIIKNDIIKTLTKFFLAMSIAIGLLITYDFFNRAKKIILETSFSNFALSIFIIFILAFVVFYVIYQFWRNNRKIKENFEKKPPHMFFFEYLGEYRLIYSLLVYTTIICSLFGVFCDMNLINMDIV